MKTLPAFKNYSIANFMIDITGDCVEAYKLDVAYDVMILMLHMMLLHYIELL